MLALWPSVGEPRRPRRACSADPSTRAYVKIIQQQRTKRPTLRWSLRWSVPEELSLDRQLAASPQKDSGTAKQPCSASKSTIRGDGPNFRPSCNSYVRSECGETAKETREACRDQPILYDVICLDGNTALMQVKRGPCCLIPPQMRPM